METGTQILVERMKTHPEEFVDGFGNKWAQVMAMANEWLPDEDKKAIGQAYKEARVSLFNETVLKTLAGENTPVEDTMKYKASERYGVGVTDPRAFGQAQIKAEGQYVFNPAQNSLTAGANGMSSNLIASAFGAVPRSTHE